MKTRLLIVPGFFAYKVHCCVLLAITLYHFDAIAQSTSSIPLSIEWRSNGTNLVVSTCSQTGALFLQMASDLQMLATNPMTLFQTNTPLPNGLRLPLSPLNLSTQGFFTSSLYPGESVEDFGDPEYYLPETAPTIVLFSAGIPTDLVSGQRFLAAFLVTDPTGESVDLTASATFLVVRSDDGAIHPDATVSPISGQMTNGFFQLQITINSLTSLDGYTLALSVGSASYGVVHPMDLGPFLKVAFDLGSLPPASQQPVLLERLARLRMDNADSGSAWDCPLPLPLTGHYKVYGTFGEWRGDDDTRCHHGLDLAGAVATTVMASRAGVVSATGTIPGKGDYVTLDHGNGWFSRYLHLDHSHIRVNPGQVVARGTPLADHLYTALGHLHFEIRLGVNRPQWTIPSPGQARDPLLASGIFPVPSANHLPSVEIFGITNGSPGQTIFGTSPPNVEVLGDPVYVFVKVSDLESPPGRHPNPGPRSISFLLPESAKEPQLIKPFNDEAIPPYLPPGINQKAGFAKYHITQNPNDKSHYVASTVDYFRYWFLWDTSSYALNHIGPRSFQIGVTGFSGLTTNYTFLFGPKIKGGVFTHVNDNIYVFTNVAYLGTNLLKDPSKPDPIYSQPDRYKLEIIQANGQPLGDIKWSPPLTKGYTRLFTVHTNEEICTFELPNGTDTHGLKLCISSQLVTNIADEVCFCVSPNLVSIPNLVPIPAGSFVMGSPTSELARNSDEAQTQVTISKSFCMGTHEVTQGEFLALMGYNPSWYQGVVTLFSGIEGEHQVDVGADLSRPVEQVSWSDAVAYCAALTIQERAAGRLPKGYVFRLPTEAEWEYACRAGTTTPFFWGSASGSTNMNYDESFLYPPCGDSLYYCYDLLWGLYFSTRPTPVETFATNRWGLFDMHGNVWEWCHDWYGTYQGGIDPQGPPSGTYRVVRGGGWDYAGYYCRSAYRAQGYPTGNSSSVGFRVVLAGSSQP